MRRKAATHADGIDGGPNRDTNRSRLHPEARKALRRYALTGVATLLIVLVPVIFGARAFAKDQALRHAMESTQHMADFEVAPFIDSALPIEDPVRLDRLDRRLTPSFRHVSLYRFKVWNSAGIILYSDRRELIGRQFPRPDWAGPLLAGGAGRAEFEAQTDAESVLEASQGELVEVYVGATASDGERIIVEAYYPAEIVRDDQRSMVLGILPGVFASLLLLQALLLIPGLRMAKRLQRNADTQQRLLEQAISASDLERQRLARHLHDEVIQGLAGLAYTLESYELGGTDPSPSFFARANAVLQENIGALRGIATDLYPPDLAELGLSGALARLGDPARSRGVDFDLQVRGAPTAEPTTQVLLYRVAREAIANALKHADAGRISVALAADPVATKLTVADDGRGFDVADAVPEGHLGLAILHDTVAEAGGSLLITSAADSGTKVEAVLPAAAG
ncbi:histidine kinase [Arthrobacter sp. I2-34]|uniref:Histidine kinase n=1 Tax=Arthrobacter hankyongi TaxID=2904801 RepID=A0ABS9L217_9MICC|nr:ATP-binding protein [Arthrobacter hankyongi]MCG2620613.1 histidine kinase [Arthrobacter hankyongi]